MQYLSGRLLLNELSLKPLLMLLIQEDEASHNHNKNRESRDPVLIAPIQLIPPIHRMVHSLLRHGVGARRAHSASFPLHWSAGLPVIPRLDRLQVVENRAQADQHLDVNSAFSWLWEQGAGIGDLERSQAAVASLRHYTANPPG
ncbi:hypothetical protein [Synechococcus sp. CS-1328]|uniref:hypothetical protein n=1 Tax=Synechococcus sp. CS-1328 TaxID=2847976 RepID=UPI00223B3672|nr:hypothetical protein [Synechococcus sp. CS-1328]MCT0223654.1 hypothetical protein [Synechococcus sp. CS-1328]